MKLKLTFVFCCIATLFLHSQTNVFTKGTDVPDDGTYNRFIETADSGFMHTTLVIDPALSQPFVHMIKYDRYGTIQWSRRIDAGEFLPTSNSSCPVIQTHDGGYAITLTYHMTVPDCNYATIIRTDAMGNVLWSQWYPGMDRSWGNGICETVNHDLVVCGRTSDSTGLPRYGFAFRTDSIGNQLWAWTYDCPLYSYEEFFTVRESFTGDLLMFGTFQKRGIYLRINSGGAPLVDVISNGVGRFVDGLETPSGNVVMMGVSYAQAKTSVYEVTAAGAVVWSRKYYYGTHFRGASMTTSPGGNGYAMISLPTIGIPAKVAHIDLSGNTIWARQYSDMNGEKEPCIVNTGDYGYCFAGEHNANSSQDFSVVVIKTDSLGMAQCSSSTVPVAIDTAVTPYSDTFLITNVMGALNPNLVSQGVLLHLIEFCPSGLDDHTLSDDVQVYPNPSHDQLFVDCGTHDAQRRIRLCDATGKTVLAQPAVESLQTLNISGLAPGMYVMLIEAEAGVISAKRIIVQ